MKSDRPHMPGYGLQPPTEKDGLLPWTFVSQRMAQAWNYWVATASPAGIPHAVPVWGIWVDERFYFSTGQTSRKGRNLAANPRVVVHLESGDEAVILHGRVEEVPPGELFSRLDETYYQKYDVHLTDESPVYGVVVTLAMAWQEREFPTSATRWRFDEGKEAPHDQRP